VKNMRNRQLKAMQLPVRGCHCDSGWSIWRKVLFSLEATSRGVIQRSLLLILCFFRLRCLLDAFQPFLTPPLRPGPFRRLGNDAEVRPSTCRDEQLHCNTTYVMVLLPPYAFNEQVMSAEHRVAMIHICRPAKLFSN
jgi:hypothetical protein